MIDFPKKRKPDSGKPKIWAEGGQRPPFDLRAFGRASLFLGRSGVAPLLGWAAGSFRRIAVTVAAGAGRIPEAKLGRAARFVPSHQRVAAWVKNLAAVLAHASATADPDVKRGNSLVARIEPHLWPDGTLPEVMPVEPDPAPAVPEAIEPVVLPEPMQLDDDPLLSIRDDLDGRKPAGGVKGPVAPPSPPGPVATAAIQVSGYLIGWVSSLIALPYGLAHALWKHIKGEDLRKLGLPD
ncbi:MAG: hypothetical protein C0524_17325 [Rhodobacter sp.]|nr:hypothetical protein [Rhodobacter sp.]